MNENPSEAAPELSRQDKLRKWLERNKVFFETAAATLLSAMALVISISQICISIKQNDMIRIQTQIAEKELRIVQRQDNVQQAVGWIEIRNTVLNIIDQYPGTGPKAFKSLSAAQKVEWFEKIRRLLDSQIKNPTLIQNKECLIHWERAIATARGAAGIFAKTDMSAMPDFFEINANSILVDTLAVMKIMFNESDKVFSRGSLTAD